MIRVKITASSPAPVNQVVKRELLRAMKENTALLKKAWVQRAPVGGTGKYKSGIRAKVVDYLHAEVGVEGVAKEYAPFVELGRGPGGFPPVNKIRAWILRSAVGQRILASIKRKYRLTTEAAIRTAVFLVGRKIAQRGVKAKRVMQKAFNATRSQINRNFQAAANRIQRALR